MQFEKTDQTKYQLEMAAERVERLRAERDAAIAAFDAQQAHLISLLDELGQKSVNTSRYKVTKRYSERVVVDEKSLRKALGAPAFNKLTDRKLNKTKLNVAVREGQLDPVIVAQCSQIVESAAWVTISEVKETEESDQ